MKKWKSKGKNYLLGCNLGNDRLHAVTLHCTCILTSMNAYKTTVSANVNLK